MHAQWWRKFLSEGVDWRMSMPCQMERGLGAQPLPQMHGEATISVA